MQVTMTVNGTEVINDKGEWVGPTIGLAGPTGEASTEDLRLALRSYRQFVDRLLGLAS